MDGLLLHLVVAVAAFAQAVTGIGFGMIAGPFILVALDDPSAVVASTLLSWLIAALLLPFLWRGADRGMLLRLSAGAALGLPAGLALLAAADAALLKALAGLAVGGLTLAMMTGLPGMRRPGTGGDLAYGALGGCLGGCLAMPGPAAAIRLGALGHGKEAVRATMVCFFAVAWPVVFLGQAAAAGLPGETLAVAATLAPATLAGLAAGQAAAGRVSEGLFRRGVLAFLLATSAGLLGGAAWRLA